MDLSAPRIGSPFAMLRAVPLILIFVLAMTLAVTVKVEEARLHRVENRAAVAALGAANALALRDTTHDVALENARVAALVRGSLRIVEKRVVQVAQTRDEIDVALGRERMARYELTGTVDSLQARVASLSRDREDGARVAEFNIRAAPYTITAEAVLPPMPDSAILALRVRLDTIPINLQLGCSEPGDAGVRTATVLADSPPWASLQFRNVSQGPGICTPAPVITAYARGLSRRPHLVLGVGRQFGERRSSWAAFLGLAFLTLG